MEDVVANKRHRELILDTWIDSVGWQAACAEIMEWARNRERRYVCICNVHSVVTAISDSVLRKSINSADLATPDGMPVAWLIGRRLKKHQARINGPDLMTKLCEHAERAGVRIAFYGSSDATLEKLKVAMVNTFPKIQIASAISPPFRELSESEQQNYVAEINHSGAGIIFVGLGCPKQEAWMLEKKGEIDGVMIGVGAAFDFFAGTLRRPPFWMRNVGLEWFGRLLAEPRRLWRRYLYTNSIFAAYVVKECLLGLGVPRTQRKRR